MLLNAYALNEVVLNGDSEQISDVTSVVLNTVFGTASLVVACPVGGDPIASAAFSPLIVYPGAAPASGTAYLTQSLTVSTVFGVPSASYGISYAPMPLEVGAAFGTAVVVAIHEANGTDVVSFSDVEQPIAGLGAAGMLAQTAFGESAAIEARGMGEWYSGPKFGIASLVSFAMFPMSDGLDSVEFCYPFLGATAHKTIPLHMMPAFDPVTIHRSHTC